MAETTYLRDLHEGLGARFTDFGGWEMPLRYEGVIAEHWAVRERVGVFDVSHLGRFRVSGSGATDLLRTQLCNDVGKVDPGRAQYTMALNERAGIEDDIIVWRHGEEDYWVLPNGVNFDEIVATFRDSAASEVTLEPLRDQTVLLAVQGPTSPEALEEVLGMAPGRFRVGSGELHGQPFWAAGTGYTGEQGAEIAVPPQTAPALWNALLEAGATPCGLGARDTLRLEMGYPLWGQDLDETTTPLEAGLGWVVAWDHDFVGKEALNRQREEGPARRLVAFQTEGRAIPRHGYRLRSGEASGTVASGNFSPLLQRGIGMGYMSPPPREDEIEVEMRGGWVLARVIEPPFVDR